MTMARAKAGGKLEGTIESGEGAGVSQRSRESMVLVRRVVAGDAARRLDRRDRVLEHHVIGAAVIDDEREAIEILDSALERLAVEEPDRNDQLFASRDVQERVLD